MAKTATLKQDPERVSKNEQRGWYYFAKAYPHAAKRIEEEKSAREDLEMVVVEVVREIAEKKTVGSKLQDFLSRYL
jgi:hypothetical protein